MKKLAASAHAGEISASGAWSGGQALAGWFGRPFWVGVLALLLALLVIPPVIFLITTSLFTTDRLGGFEALTFDYYVETFTNPRLLINLLNTTIFSLGAAALAIVVGVLLAWIVERTNTPLRGAILAVSIVSLGTPHILYTIAWLLILGKSGPVNEAIIALLGEPYVFNVYSLWGMILIEGMVWTPLAFLLVSSVMRSSDPSLEEAAVMSGGTVSHTFWFVTLPLAIPGITALLLLIFIRTFESFEVAAVVGLPGRVSVMTTDIFHATRLSAPPKYGQSAAFSVIMLVIVALLLTWYNRLSRHAHRFQTITGKGFRPRQIDLGAWRYLTAAVLMTFVALIVVLPVGIIAWAAMLTYYDGVNVDALERLTLANFELVYESETFRSAIFNTIVIGVTTASAVVALTAVAGWLVVRRAKGAWVLDQLASMPLVFPAIVLGVAFLQIFLNTPFGLYGTLASLVIASATLYLPYGMRYAYAGALQIHRELEEAASVSGAGTFATYIRIVAPLLFPAVFSVWLLIFLMSVRAISMPLMLVGPDTQVVAVSLFDLWNNGQITELAAMGITWMLLMTGVSLAFYVFTRRYGIAFH